MREVNVSFESFNPNKLNHESMLEMKQYMEQLKYVDQCNDDYLKQCK